MSRRRCTEPALGHGRSPRNVCARWRAAMWCSRGRRCTRSRSAAASPTQARSAGRGVTLGRKTRYSQRDRSGARSARRRVVSTTSPQVNGRGAPVNVGGAAANTGVAGRTWIGRRTAAPRDAGASGSTTLHSTTSRRRWRLRATSARAAATRTQGSARSTSTMTTPPASTGGCSAATATRASATSRTAKNDFDSPSHTSVDTLLRGRIRRGKGATTVAKGQGSNDHGRWP